MNSRPCEICGAWTALICTLCDSPLCSVHLVRNVRLSTHPGGLRCRPLGVALPCEMCGTLTAWQQGGPRVLCRMHSRPASSLYSQPCRVCAKQTTLICSLCGRPLCTVHRVRNMRLSMHPSNLECRSDKGRLTQKTLPCEMCGKPTVWQQGARVLCWAHATNTTEEVAMPKLDIDGGPAPEPPLGRAGRRVAYHCAAIIAALPHLSVYEAIAVGRLAAALDLAWPQGQARPERLEM